VNKGPSEGLNKGGPSKLLNKVGPSEVLNKGGPSKVLNKGGPSKENTARYIPWAECPSREEELNAADEKNKNKRARTSKAMETDDKGFVKIVANESSATADFSKSGLLNFVLTRRGVALDDYDVMSYMSHDTICQRLMSELLDEPVDPHFEGPSIEQLKKADSYIFRMLGVECPGGIRRTANGTLPMDDAIDNVLSSSKLGLILAGNRRQGGSGGGRGRDEVDTEDKES
jgi:hypothetical protein